MHRFDSFLVRDDCVTELKTLDQQPNVEHVVRLPRGWVFYECHHELFEDPDFLVEGVWREKMERLPELRRSRIDMLNQERGLIAPWYAKTKKLGDADAMGASEICAYRVNSLTRMRWIDFLLADGWGSARECVVTLDSTSATFPSMLYQLIDEWNESGATAGELRVSSRIEPPDHGGSLIFTTTTMHYSGRWLAALWALLSDGRWKTGVRSMRVTARG